MAGRIDSRQNERYRAWLAIAHRKKGRETSLVLLEGLRLCSDAVQSGVAVDVVLLAESAPGTIIRFAAQLPPGPERWTLSDALFRSLCDTEHPQGLALVCRSPILHSPGEKPRPDGLYLVADGISDPGNLGTMIRTADAFAFDGVLVTAGTVWPMNPKVIRAAMGSCFHLPILSFETIETAAAWLAESNVPLFAADPLGQVPVSRLPAGGAALLIGNEAHGLSAQACSLAAYTVRIPMPGRSESLNAAAATAICAYELMKKR